MGTKKNLENKNKKVKDIQDVAQENDKNKIGSLKSKVFDRIKKDKIKPIPEWQFLLKKWVFWGGFGVSVVFGALSMSVMFYLLNVQDWDLYMRVHDNFLKFFFFAVPYFWLIVLLGFAFVAFYNYKHTDTGYRHNYVYVFFSSIFISIGLGGVFFMLGVSEWIDDEVRERVPMYKDIHSFQERMWVSPEKGLLSGRVVRVFDDGVMIVDVKGDDWRVVFLETRDLRDRFLLEEGKILKFVGELRKDGVFEALEVRPWEKRPPKDFLK